MSSTTGQKFSKQILAAFIWLFLPLLSAQAATPSITLSQRQLCDLELLMNGGFSPLDGFMDSKTYERVVKEMRLLDGSVWPIPIVLDIDDKVRQKIAGASEIALRDPEGFVLANLQVAEIYKPNKLLEVEKVYGTSDLAHPGVDYVLNQAGEFYVAGKVSKICMPKHYDFLPLRRTPEELKALFKKNGYKKIVAFQTRNPMHRAHLELTTRASKEVGAHLLVHPVVGMTKPGDVDYFTRVKCYRKLMSYYPEGSATLSLLPISMRMAGPREAVWHAIIRKNYGCTHFIVGRDHAGPGKDSNGVDFYSPYAAQELALKYAKELGITIVPFMEMVYVQEDDNYQPIDKVPAHKTVLNISGTQLRKFLREGKEIPHWFSFPEVVSELRKVYPPRLKQGFTIFFTGLSGAGKSTIANALGVKLIELQSRPITILDGDIIRTHLSKGLKFTKEDRSDNVRRVGFVASEITKNGGAALCALIAPYQADRLYNRNLISNGGGYIEIHVATSLEECEKRDTKGHYSLARQGKMKEFTGIDDPYDVPQKAEMVIDTSTCSVIEAVDRILDYLRNEGYME